MNKQNHTSKVITQREQHIKEVNTMDEKNEMLEHEQEWSSGKGDDEPSEETEERNDDK